MSCLNQGCVFYLESRVNSGPWGGLFCLLDGGAPGRVAATGSFPQVLSWLAFFLFHVLVLQLDFEPLGVRSPILDGFVCPSR